MNLALFDFDGTITTKETFTGFMRYSLPKHRLVYGCALILPDAIQYYLGYLHARKVRKKLCKLVFNNRSLQTYDNAAYDYAKQVIPNYIREDARQRIEWHKSRGDRVVIVSASLDLYLKHWCQINDVELICTRMASKNGKLTGDFIGADCSSEEKRQRVLAYLNIDEYETVYAYGDTVEDTELLELADERYYRYFS